MNLARKSCLLTGLAAMLLLTLAGCASDAKPRSTSTTAENGPSSDQYETPGPRDSMSAVMQAKLAHSQAILEGIALADFHQVEANADALHQISLSADWLVHDTESYYAFSDRFREATMQIVGHAREKNLEAIAADYARLTHTCIDCHSWLRHEKETKDMPGKVTMALP